MYGIRVPFAKDDYIWVTDTKNFDAFNPKPLLFDNEEDAYEIAKSFGPLAYVKKIEKNDF